MQCLCSYTLNKLYLRTVLHVIINFLLIFWTFVSAAALCFLEVATCDHQPAVLIFASINILISSHSLDKHIGHIQSPLPCLLGYGFMQVPCNVNLKKMFSAQTVSK